jgi:Zn-dependent M28 family amino/carboxypeptidase
VGNLVLALSLARLFQTSSSSYSPYQYRVRFCWWGAEELGLIGARYHVDQALLPSTTTEGERFQDYLLNLNYDMLAGPNYRFGIHDSTLVPATTPLQALPGTTRITDLFRQWFNEQNLPWSNSSLGGGSDYVPFLAAGLAVGGVNTGAGGIKPASERDQYSAVLGIGNGGLANAAYDPCYHQQCDRITNINPFAYEKVVKSAAYAIEYLGRLNDLEQWLYPQGRTRNLPLPNQNQIYDFQEDPNMI